MTKRYLVSCHAAMRRLSLISRQDVTRIRRESTKLQRTRAKARDKRSLEGDVWDGKKKGFLMEGGSAVYVTAKGMGVRMTLGGKLIIVWVARVQHHYKSATFNWAWPGSLGYCSHLACHPSAVKCSEVQ